MAFNPKRYRPKSPRVKNMPRELEDILIAKMIELNTPELRKACEAGDGNMIVALCGDAYTALKVREKTNKNDGFMVEMTQKVGGGKKGWAWCMYQQQAQVGIAEILTNKVSLVPLSGGVQFVWNASKKVVGLLRGLVKDAQAGDILIHIGTKGTGHTENFKRWMDKPTKMLCNGGNTTSGKAGDKVVREGGGSYLTERSASYWVGFVRPFPDVAKEITQPKVPKVADQGQIPKYGERSDRVASLQRALNEKGAKPKLAVDTEFGPRTKKAVSAFQKQNGLPGSGVIGKKTMELLGL